MVKFLTTIDPREAPKKTVKLSAAEDDHHKNALIACLDAVNRLLEEGTFLFNLRADKLTVQFQIEI